MIHEPYYILEENKLKSYFGLMIHHSMMEEA